MLINTEVNHWDTHSLCSTSVSSGAGRQQAGLQGGCQLNMHQVSLLAAPSKLWKPPLIQIHESTTAVCRSSSASSFSVGRRGDEGWGWGGGRGWGSVVPGDADKFLVWKCEELWLL